MPPNPTIQDKACARIHEEHAAKVLSETLATYVDFPSDEHEALLQKQIRDYRQKWMHLRVRDWAQA